MPTNAASCATAPRMRSASAASVSSASGSGHADAFRAGSSSQPCRMSCAATSSRAALRRAPGRPRGERALGAPRVVYRSSTRATGRPKRPASWRAKRSRARRHRVRRAIGMHRNADDEHVAAATRRSAPRSRRSASRSRRRRSSSAAVRDAQRACCRPRRRSAACRNRTRAPWLSALAVCAAVTRHACPTSSDRREKSMPSSRIAAGSRCFAGVLEQDARDRPRR